MTSITKEFERLLRHNRKLSFNTELQDVITNTNVISTFVELEARLRDMGSNYVVKYGDDTQNITNSPKQ